MFKLNWISFTIYILSGATFWNNVILFVTCDISLRTYQYNYYYALHCWERLYLRLKRICIQITSSSSTSPPWLNCLQQARSNLHMIMWKDSDAGLSAFGKRLLRTKILSIKKTFLGFQWVIRIFDLFLLYPYLVPHLNDIWLSIQSYQVYS